MGNCTVCGHPRSEHTGRDGECRHDFVAYAERAKEQCLCIQGRYFK